MHYRFQAGHVPNPAPSEAHPLTVELDFFSRIKPELLASYRGKFAVIQGENLYGCWDTYGDALQHGYQTFGLDPFLVKEVLESEPVHRVFSLGEVNFSPSNRPVTG